MTPTKCGCLYLAILSGRAVQTRRHVVRVRVHWVPHCNACSAHSSPTSSSCWFLGGAGCRLTYRPYTPPFLILVQPLWAGIEAWIPCPKLSRTVSFLPCTRWGVPRCYWSRIGCFEVVGAASIIERYKTGRCCGVEIRKTVLYEHMASLGFHGLPAIGLILYLIS